jgi:hypothetical protein
MPVRDAAECAASRRREVVGADTGRAADRRGCAGPANRRVAGNAIADDIGPTTAVLAADRDDPDSPGRGGRVETPVALSRTQPASEFW